MIEWTKKQTETVQRNKQKQCKETNRNSTKKQTETEQETNNQKKITVVRILTYECTVIKWMTDLVM